ncbi:MAG: DUF3598 domain-containing protein [Betaproteobacteria bacterium]|jgi:hypothetical protein
MNPIKQSMPALLRHNGIWEGIYHLVDAEGKTLDRHHSCIEVRFPESGSYHYTQKNYFWWGDGRDTHGEYPGVCRDGVLYWDNELIRGKAWSVDELSTVLTWQRHDTPDAYLYELIVINQTNDQRSRTWHWFRDGVIYQRTLIEESKISD